MPNTLGALRNNVAIFLGKKRAPKKFLGANDFKMFYEKLKKIEGEELETFWMEKCELFIFDYIQEQNKAFVWSEIDLLLKRDNPLWLNLNIQEQRASVVAAMLQTDKMQFYLQKVSSKFFERTQKSLFNSFDFEGSSAFCHCCSSKKIKSESSKFFLTIWNSNCD